MRILVLLRGLPGCGKSTWVKENDLEEYSLTPDLIRKLCCVPELNSDGTVSIASKDDSKVWEIFTSIVESRLKNGDFTIIDATNISTKEMNRWKNLAHTYKYRMYCVDFTDIPLSEVKRRNENREEERRVSEKVINKFYSRLQNKENFVPSGITVLRPEEYEKILLNPLDLNKYNKIHCVGDIHGCYTVLNEYLKEGLKEDEYYIFLGDYIDRGIENAKTINFLMSIANLPNVLMLEGNHEKWLNMWANNEKAYSREFEENTRVELEQAGVKRKMVKVFYRKLAQCAYFTFNGNIYFASHGGVSTIKRNPIFISTSQMIEGVGGYPDVQMVENTFDKTMPENVYQIHGHRNLGYPIHSSKRNYNLEGEIEKGGFLRAIEISKSGIDEIELKNDVYKKPDFSSVHTAIKSLRKDSFIKEKTFGNISSFNFTRDAFNSRTWNERTEKARGLYINTKTEEIVARGYDKFFNIGELPNTELSNLKKKFEFPINIYVKENGFLGLVSLDRETNDFFITTKSDPSGIVASWMRELFYKTVPNDVQLQLKDFLAKNNVTLVFECVDQEHDPHIIDYPESKLYLLDIIYNDFNFNKFSYDELRKFVERFNLPVKTLAFTFSDWDSFNEWYINVNITGENYLYNNHAIEGFVIEDSNHYMVKMKLDYYKKWKRYRRLVEIIDKIDISLLTSEELDFVKFVKELFDKGVIKKNDLSSNICNLRKLYERRVS